MALSCLRDDLRRQGEVDLPAHGNHRSSRHMRDVAMERIGGLEDQGAPPDSAECQQETLEHLIGSVRCEDLILRHTVKHTQPLTKGGGEAIRISVQPQVVDPLGEF